MLLRFSLDSLAAGSVANPMVYNTNQAFTLTAAEGGTSTAYLASNSLTVGPVNTIRVFKLPESSSTITFTDVSFTADPSTMTYVCPGPDGRDWCGRLDNRVTAGWLANGELGFMWTAPQGMLGTQSYLYPFIHVVRLTADTSALIAEPSLVSSLYAYAYPSAAPNSAGAIAGTLFYGGNLLYPTLGAFIWDAQSGPPPPWEVHLVQSSVSGPSTNEWGDFLTTARYRPDQTGWIATGFTVSDLAGDITPYYLHLVRPAGSTATPQPTPVATATPTSTPTSTATPTRNGTSTPTATAGPPKTSTPTPAPTDTPTATGTIAPTGTPAPTDTPTATGTVASTDTPAATGTAAPTSTPTPVFAPTRFFFPEVAS